MLNPRYILHTDVDLTALSRSAAQYWIEQAEQAIKQRGVFHVALTGGSSPQPLYRLLAKPEMAENVEWSRVHIFIGDERYVAHDHPDSNFGMARDCLLDHVAIPDKNIHPMPTHYDHAGEAAEQYASLISEIIPSAAGSAPVFDLIMLGMGDDGHTASLFPGTDILLNNDKTVAAVYVEKLGCWRISMTYPSLNQARQVMVMVSGENKATILAHVLEKGSELVYPIQSVLPAGEMHWFIDHAAASKLDQLSS